MATVNQNQTSLDYFWFDTQNVLAWLEIQYAEPWEI